MRRQRTIRNVTLEEAMAPPKSGTLEFGAQAGYRRRKIYGRQNWAVAAATGRAEKKGGKKIARDRPSSMTRRKQAIHATQEYAD